MPSIDAAALRCSALPRPGLQVGTLVQQVAPAQVATLRITYWGRIVDLDANSVTRSVLSGYLRASAARGSFVNAPFMLERLGVKVEVVKSTDDNGLHRADEGRGGRGRRRRDVRAGTFIGKANKPRIVEINGRQVEADASGKLLLVENDDDPA